jgi:hypothetical protein
VPEAVGIFCSNEKCKNRCLFQGGKGKLSRFRLKYYAGGYGQMWEDEPSFPSISQQPIYSRCQDSGCAGGCGIFFSNEKMQEQMPFPKEAKGNSQDSGYSTMPEAMVKFGKTIPSSPALAISIYPQDAKTQDVPEAMIKLSSHEQVQEQMTLTKEAKGISQESRYNTAPEAMVESGQTSPPSQC